MRLPALLICFILPFTAQAFQNEPNGFRGIKWGDSFNSHKNKFILVSGKGSNSHIYKRKNDKHSIGGAKLNNAWYKFYKNKFSSVIVTTKGTSNNSALMAAFKSQFGSGNKPNQFMDRYLWSGDSTQIYLECSKIKKSCTGHLKSKKISKLEAKDKQKAAAAAGDDF